MEQVDCPIRAQNLPKMDEQNHEIMYSYGKLKNCRNGLKSSFVKN